MKVTKAIATTKKGSSSFNLLNPERFLQELAEYSGHIEITIKQIEEDATEKQKAYFRYEVLNTFVSQSAEGGQVFSDCNAERYLLGYSQFEEDSIDKLSKSQLSFLIENSKLFLNDMFGVELK